MHVAKTVYLRADIAVDFHGTQFDSMIQSLTIHKNKLLQWINGNYETIFHCGH